MNVNFDLYHLPDSSFQLKTYLLLLVVFLRSVYWLLLFYLPLLLKIPWYLWRTVFRNFFSMISLFCLVFCFPKLSCRMFCSKWDISQNFSLCSQYIYFLVFFVFIISLSILILRSIFVLARFIQKIRNILRYNHISKTSSLLLAASVEIHDYAPYRRWENI